MLWREEEVFMATLQVAPSRHCHTEQFSGTLIDQYLPGPYLKSEGGMRKKPKHKSTPSIAGETDDWHCFKVNFA